MTNIIDDLLFKDFSAMKWTDGREFRFIPDDELFRIMCNSFENYGPESAGYTISRFILSGRKRKLIQVTREEVITTTKFKEERKPIRNLPGEQSYYIDEHQKGRFRLSDDYYKESLSDE